VLQFVGGFVVGLLTVVVFFLRKKMTGTQKGVDSHLEQLEELSKLTGGLAHEIKNPLSTVKINLKLVGEDLEGFDRTESTGSGVMRDDGKLKRALRKLAVIEKETDRLEQILEGFLHYVGRTELQLANVDVNDLVGDMVDFYSPQARAHAITIHQGLHGEPLVCKLDADMLKQVILLSLRSAIPAGASRQTSLIVCSMLTTRLARRAAVWACRLRRRLSKRITDP